MKARIVLGFLFVVFLVLTFALDIQNPFLNRWVFGGVAFIFLALFVKALIDNPDKPR